MTQGEQALIYQTVRTIAPQLVALQRALFDAGLLETARSVNEASQKLGWEAARKVTKGEQA
jgi:hypothetical protein